MTRGSGRICLRATDRGREGSWGLQKATASQWKETRDGRMDRFSSVKRNPRSPPEIRRKGKERPGDVAFEQDIRTSEGREDYSGEREGQVGPGAEPWGAEVRDVPPKWMTAMYFRGQREQLKVNPTADVELPRSRFTLELWIKPEGGQNNPAIIAGWYLCRSFRLIHLCSTGELFASMRLYIVLCWQHCEETAFRHS